MPPNSRTQIPRVPLERDTQVVHKPHPHDSARLHVRGLAPYIDDHARAVRGCCIVAVGGADRAAGQASIGA